jgi:L-arabinokinase
MHNRARPVVAAYLSGHGYGHFTRSAAVLERLAGRARIHVRTSAQALRLARRAAWADSVEEIDVGPGVAQRGPLAVDVEATRAALQHHLDRLPSLIAAEATWLAAAGAALVFADVPPLAFAAAARARVPSVGMSNFTWSWIYEGYAHHDPWFSRAASRLRAEEALATSFLALAGGGGLDHLRAVTPIAPIARPPRLGASEVRARLGLDGGDPRPVVLASFGGFGGELDLRHAAMHNRGLRVLLVSGPRDLVEPDFRSIEPAGGPAGGPGGEPAGEPADRVGHPELTAAADCLIGKPGYGTFAECLHRPTPFVHVPRGEFREAGPLVERIAAWLPSAPLAIDDLLAGRWSDAVARAMSARPPEPRPAATGMAEAAEAVAARLAIEAPPSLDSGGSRT